MAAGRLSSATVTLNPKDQKMEAIQCILAKVGGMAGCDHCGRIALLRVDFLSDPPPPDLAKDGAISIVHE
jgi:hypothetical protein